MSNKDYNITININNPDKKINHCNNCSKILYNNYKLCYTCYKKQDQKEKNQKEIQKESQKEQKNCIKCNKLSNSKYDLCYNCYSNGLISAQIPQTNISVPIQQSNHDNTSVNPANNQPDLNIDVVIQNNSANKSTDKQKIDEPANKLADKQKIEEPADKPADTQKIDESANKQTDKPKLIKTKEKCDCLSASYGFPHKKENCALNKIFGSK